ncbi:lanthionine synthetase LanC family protein [Cellulomonas oligotrophica]|uniref:lanthionine synthetase LanC family protein n=1 Tax=Cellulomonas oligotrophica TaxID=931536 RepID=UPI0031E71711
MDVGWADYDLFHGPAGLVLAGAARAADTAVVAPAARHLAGACDAALSGLRAGTDVDPRSAFNVGRVNTGVGHGAAGVASALRHAAETLDDGQQYLPALRRVCAWLLEQAYLTDDGLVTWPPVGRDGAPATGHADRRQAWCYGTPGVAWALLEAGRVLHDPDLRTLGTEAMASFCRVFDPDLHLEAHGSAEGLAVCHGAAGTLAVADAFARHADLDAAAVLRASLLAHLARHADDVRAVAATDMTTLTGASGVVATMLVAQGAARDHLPQLTLR